MDVVDVTNCLEKGGENQQFGTDTKVLLKSLHNCCQPSAITRTIPKHLFNFEFLERAATRVGDVQLSAAGTGDTGDRAPVTARCNGKGTLLAPTGRTPRLRCMTGNHVERPCWDLTVKVPYPYRPKKHPRTRSSTTASVMQLAGKRRNTHISTGRFRICRSALSKFSFSLCR